MAAALGACAPQPETAQPPEAAAPTGASGAATEAARAATPRLASLKAQQQNPIRLKARTFEPEPGIDKTLGDYMRRLQRVESAHVIVQFLRHPSLEERAKLEEAFGLVLLDPIPERAYYASIPTNLAIAEKLIEELDLVRWIGRIEPEFRLAPWLAKGLPDWAKRSKKAAEVIVQFFSDVSEREQLRALSRLSAKPLTRIEPINGWRIEIATSDLKRLSAEDSVKWIEEVPPPPEDDNDGARSATSTNAEPVYPPAPYGLTGNGVILAQWESRHAGAGHADFGGRITVGDPPIPALERSYLHDETVAANGAYDDGEAIYRDVDDSATVSAGDIRETATGGFLAGSTVGGTDLDVGAALVFFLSSEHFEDSVTADAVYTAGEGIYSDADSNNSVSVGDTRLSPVDGFLAGSVVAMGDGDLGGFLRRFRTIPHTHATHVAGTAIGSGAQSAANGGTANQWQGLAPGATLRSYSGNPTSATGAPVPADEYSDAAANNVAISTNSWGTGHCHQVFPPATCYDTGSQYYDSVVSGRQSDGTASGIARQVSIFASSGNRGRPERHSEDVAANGQFDDGESIYRDRNDDGLVDIFDELRVGPGVANGSVLINFNLDEAHDDSVDINDDGHRTIDAGEGIYRDADLSRTVSAGDTRINAAAGFMAGSVVSAGDTDEDTFLRSFLLWGTVRQPNSAKDTLVVGNIASDNAVPSRSTSRGPTDDGRLKPDLAGPGSQNSGDGGINSTVPGNLYAVDTGTSMSTPALSGVAALVEEWYRTACVAGGATPATIKALMIHGAENLTTIPHLAGVFDGPDFSHGYGRARAKETLDLLPHHLQATANALGDSDVTVTVGSLGQFRVTLVWDDPAWLAAALPAAATGLLQNDLDLVLIAPDGTQYTPWEINAADPYAPATRSVTPVGMPIPAAARDRRNTVEQVVIDNAMPGDWTIRVTASTLALPPQPYVLVSEALPAQSSPCTAAPAADVWLMDNPTDVGTEPSSGSMWLGPDPWNRLADDGLTTHENPEFGQTNYLYATLRNASADEVKATTLSFWVASASVGLSWPANFEKVGALSVPNMAAGEVRQVGPLAWDPPSPAPSNHFCMYVRVDSPQDNLPLETASILTNARDNNNLVYRNLSIVDLLSSKTVAFLLRNVDEKAKAVDLTLAVPEEFLAVGRAFLALPPALDKHWVERERKTAGLVPPDPRLRVAKPDEKDPETLGLGAKGKGELVEPEDEVQAPPYEITRPLVRLRDLPLGPGEAQVLRMTFSSDRKKKSAYNVQVTEQVKGETVGGLQILVRTGHKKK